MTCAHKTILDHSSEIGGIRRWKCSHCGKVGPWTDSWGYWGNIECGKCWMTAIDWVHCSEACRVAIIAEHGIVEDGKPARMPREKKPAPASGVGAKGHCCRLGPTRRWPVTLLAILQHALGRNEYGKNRERGSERNHYVTGEGVDFDLCREAVAQGLMTEHAPREISGGDYIFTVTAAGKKYVVENSPPEPKVSRGKERYRRWLGSGAADCGVKFGDWLKSETKPKPRPWWEYDEGPADVDLGAVDVGGVAANDAEVR